MAIEFGTIVTYVDRLFGLESHMTLLSRGNARSRENLKPLCLNYQSVYGH